MDTDGAAAVDAAATEYECSARHALLVVSSRWRVLLSARLGVPKSLGVRVRYLQLRLHIHDTR